MECKRFSIYSKNILCEGRLISGYIRINGELIKDILDENIHSSQIIHSKLRKHPKQYDYGNQVIMAGGIDMNIALSPGMQDWDYTRQITSLSVLGGTTTIVNKPYLYPQQNIDIADCQSDMYQSQVSHLSQNCLTDFIQMSFISNKEVEDILKLGCFCFYTTLSKPPQCDLGRIDDVASLSKAIQNLTQDQTNCLFIHMQHNVDKDLGITSPFRSSCLKDRLNLDKEIQIVDADGIQGMYSSDEEDLDPENLRPIMDASDGSPVARLLYSKDGCLSPQKSPFQIKEVSMNLQSPIIDEKKFLYQSRNVNKSVQYELISRAEMLSYNNDFTLKASKQIKEAPRMTSKKNSGEMPQIPEELMNHFLNELILESDQDLIRSNSKQIMASNPNDPDGQQDDLREAIVKEGIDECLVNVSINGWQISHKIDSIDESLVETSIDGCQMDQKQDFVKTSIDGNLIETSIDAWQIDYKQDYVKTMTDRNMAETSIDGWHMDQKINEDQNQEQIQTSIDGWQLLDNQDDDDRYQFPRQSKNLSRSMKLKPAVSSQNMSLSQSVEIQQEYSTNKVEVSSKFKVIQSSEALEESPPLRPRSSSNLLQRRSQRGISLKIDSFHTLNTIPHKKSEDDCNTTKPPQTSKFSRDYLCLLAFRPSTWEIFALQMLHKALKTQTQGRAKNLNLILQGFSSSHSLAKMVDVKKRVEFNIFIEVSYPYLFFDSEEIKDGQTIFKADPPIRSKNNKHLLQTAITQPEWVQSVSSSHFYVDPTYKFIDTGNLRRSFSGLCSVGLQFQVIWTVLWSNTKLKIHLSNTEIEKIFLTPEDTIIKQTIINKLTQLQKLTSTGPQTMLNLKKKGQIKKGYYADLVIWDPFKFINFNLNKIEQSTKNLKVDFAKNLHIFENQNLLGSVNQVFIRGNIILEQIGPNSQQINHLPAKLINRWD